MDQTNVYCWVECSVVYNSNSPCNWEILISPGNKSVVLNIARIANAVHCHSLLSGNKNCHEFRVSIVRIVISVSNVTSLQDCLGPQVCAPIAAHNSQCRVRQVFLGQVMSSHYSDPMSQRSQACGIAPLACSLMQVQCG